MHEKQEKSVLLSAIACCFHVLSLQADRSELSRDIKCLPATDLWFENWSCVLFVIDVLKTVVLKLARDMLLGHYLTISTV